MMVKVRPCPMWNSNKTLTSGTEYYTKPKPAFGNSLNSSHPFSLKQLLRSIPSVSRFCPVISSSTSSTHAYRRVPHPVCGFCQSPALPQVRMSLNIGALLRLSPGRDANNEKEETVTSLFLFGRDSQNSLDGTYLLGLANRLILSIHFTHGPLPLYTRSRLVASQHALVRYLEKKAFNTAISPGTHPHQPPRSA